MWIRYDHYLPTIFRHLLTCYGEGSRGVLLLKSPLVGLPPSPWRVGTQVEVPSMESWLGLQPHGTDRSAGALWCNSRRISCCLGGHFVAASDFFFLVIFLGGRFLWGSKSFSKWVIQKIYIICIYIYILYMVDFLFSGKWWFGWGLEKGQKFFYRSPGSRRTWVCSRYEFWERSLIKINLSRIKH